MKPNFNPTRPLNTATLAGLTRLDQVVFESLSSGLYRMVVESDGDWYFVEAKGRALTSHNLADLQRLVLGKTIGALWLKHASCYDEMIGQPGKAEMNTLLVPIGLPEQLL